MESVGRRVVWVFIAMFASFLFRPAPLSAQSARFTASEIQTHSLVVLNGQVLDFGKSPPEPATLSHTPKPFLPWFRELDIKAFPGSEYVDVSTLPATWVTDEFLWTFRSIRTLAPGTTVVDFTWSAPNGIPLAVATFVITNSGPNAKEGSFVIAHYLNGFPISTISGAGWQLSLRTFEGIGFLDNKAAAGTWSLTQTVNGRSNTDNFFVRAMDVQDFRSKPSPFEPTGGPGFIQASLVGLPSGPGIWIPDSSTTWKLTVKDSLTQGTLFSFSGTGGSISQSFDGIATPEAVASLPTHIGSHITANQPLPPGDYPMDLAALDPVNRTVTKAEATLRISAVFVNIQLNPVAIVPSGPTLLKVLPHQTNAAISVTDSAGNLLPNRNLEIRVGGKADSGGHVANFHGFVDGSFIQRPIGSLTGPGVKGPTFLPGEGLFLYTAPLPTGQATLTYTAGEFGGADFIRAKDMASGREGTAAVAVLVPGLVQLEDYTALSAVADFTGKTSAHPVNHYLLRSAADDLLLAAQDFFQKTAGGVMRVNDCSLEREVKAPLRVSFLGGVMRVNDCSLERGGGFDIRGRWNFDVDPDFCFSAGHCMHRDGKAVDAENLENFDVLIKAMQDNHWRFQDEGQFVGLPSKFPHFDWKP